MYSHSLTLVLYRRDDLSLELGIHGMPARVLANSTLNELSDIITIILSSDFNARSILQSFLDILIWPTRNKYLKRLGRLSKKIIKHLDYLEAVP